MGNEESKSHVNHHGDQQIKIINTQNEHSEKLKDHESILWLILAVVTVNLLLCVAIELKRIFKRKALKKARSMVALTEVTANK